MIESYRFRNEGALVVLQVIEREESGMYGRTSTAWRDAKTEDLLEVAWLIGRVRRVTDEFEQRLSGLEQSIRMPLMDK